ncbi:MAG: GDP-4-dehydro-6-deoxy-D-mannose reductase [Methylobacteriaceae bacterium]|jgi:GDP-4-dehydro-6-deoxy-D-mannose reductase|nr:GDP-4-dehydro-6-deoxy-D-mannose reductase [Methylobacteriaceae bacterium]
MARFETVLLTGGTGFVGGHLSAAFSVRFPDAALVLLCRPGETPPRGSSKFVTAELTDEASVRAVIDDVRPDLVLHLAAQASVDQAIGGAEQTWRVNFCGTMWLASAVARLCPQATFLFVSSAEVYGANFRGGPVAEETPLLPLNPYARSKAAAETMLADVLPQTARLIVTRSFNHTGAGQDERFALPAFAAQIARIERGKQEPRLSVGNLSAERDFMDVEDVVDAYLRLIGVDGVPQRATFNVASGAAHPISDMLDRLRRLAHAKFEIRTDPTRVRASDIACAVGDASKLRNMTGWSPRRSVDEMLSRLLDHWRERIATADPR